MAALNEEEGIGPAISEYIDCLGDPRVLVVDGKSTDRTVEIAKDLCAEILVQDRLGKGNALLKAIEHLDLTADYFIITDADHTYPAEYVPRMVNHSEKNPDIGMVCGNRFTKDLDTRKSHNVFYYGNRIIGFTHNILNGVALADPLTGLRVVRPEILRNWKVKSEGFDIEVELNHHVEREGFSILEVPIRYRERLGKKARH